ncbi:MAG: hypothetical protein V4724_16830 [Pseudomonadota bacterium]
MWRNMIWASLLSVAAAARGMDAAATAIADWQPVANEQLEQCRGGFAIGKELMVSLDVERLVSINGSVVSDTRFNFDDVSKLTPSQAMQAQAAMAALVIQNNAGDSLIRSQTTINTTVNSLSQLKAFNFEGSLRDALSAATGPK